jgi:hypothetical protein
MKNLSSIRRRIEKLERRQELFEAAPGFDAYGEISQQALGHLSDEELKILTRVKDCLNQGRESNLSTEEAAVLEAAARSLDAALQQECERFGITVAQYSEQRGLAKPAVEHLKQLYIEKCRSEISFRNLSKRNAKWFKLV